MKRKLLIITSSFGLIFNAYALENTKLSISANNSFKQQQLNKKIITDVEVTNSDLRTHLKNVKKCSSQGFIYLKDGASDVDSDFCYDLSKSFAPESTIRPKFAGFIGPVSFSSGSGGYDATFQGRFSADKKCDLAFSGSRAMVYDDIKYLAYTLNLPANINTTPIWVYDSIQGLYNPATNSTLSKYGDVITNLKDCAGWQNPLASLKGMILQKTVDSETYFAVNYQTCDNSAHIACVYH